MTQIPQPPEILTPRGPGRRFWKKVLDDFNLQDHHHLELLTQACRCLDRVAECEARIKQDGPTVVDRFDQLKPHPLLQVEKDHRILFLRALRELQLDASAPEEARPPQLYGVRKSA